MLEPVLPRAFLDSHWEKNPLHLTRLDPDYYGALLTIGDLERLIAGPEARFPAIQLSKGGAYFPPEVYCDDVKFQAPYALIIGIRCGAPQFSILA